MAYHPGMARKTKKSTKKSSSRRKKKGSSAQGILLKATRLMLIVGVWACIGVAALVAWYAAELPSIIEKPGFERKPAITVKDIEGNSIARYGELKGINVDVSELPPHLVYAVMAIEDRRFYTHFGVDPLGLLRAVVRNTVEGRVVQGGSTITQQLAKNLFLSRERTLKRKIQEAMLALWLEAKLSKDQIMTAYLNRVYLGAGTYGVEAAAQTYFNKSARDINLREAATLAGLLKAPSRYSPLSNPKLAQERANTVLNAMEDAGYITDATAGKMIETAPKIEEKSGDGDSVRYYTDWITGDLDKLIGTPNEDIIIETTLVPEIQQAAERSLEKILEDEGKDKNVSQGAVVVLGRDGAVLAMVGGKNYGESQFNRAAQAYRQPGSSFKPVVYLTALEHGYTPDSIVIDGPITTGKYRPTNFKSEYYGEVPLNVALAYSLNTISYKLAKEIGIGYVIGTAKRLGIEAELSRDLSLALGSSGIPMTQMATAYATIANDGYAVKPYAIRRITDKDGKLIYQRSPKALQSGRPMFEPYIMQSLKGMMRGVVEFGTGQGAKFGVPSAGKTGTSQDFRDAWFTGFTDDYIAAVWVGNDDNSSMKRVTGGSIPARVWRDVMVAATNSGKGRNLSASSLSSSAPDGTSLGESDDFGSLLQRLLAAESAPSPSAATASDPSAMTLLSAPVSAKPDDGSSKSWKLND
jgi:penicillin-binding protein 1A